MDSKTKLKMIAVRLPIHIVKRLQEEKLRSGMPIERQVANALERTDQDVDRRATVRG